MKKILISGIIIIGVALGVTYFLLDWKTISWFQKEYVNAIYLDTPIIPHGINYKITTDEINKHAVMVLQKSINEENAIIESYSLLIIGPTLWGKYSNNPSLKGIGINSSAIINKKEVPIRTYTSKEDGEVFTREFKKEIFHKDSIIRKATVDELHYYWATIPFDIEEPLLIVESNSGKYLFNFSGNNGVNWIDQIP